MECHYCGVGCQKAGKQKNGVQKYHCKGCSKYQQAHYVYQACKADTAYQVVAHVKEGCGIRSIGRLLTISATSVIAVIRREAAKVTTPENLPLGGEYQVDELHTFVGKKENQTWVCYALRKDSKEVVSLSVGSRSKANLQKVTERVLSFSPAKVHTDGLHVYPSLIPPNIHVRKKHQINHIERKNLTLRTHLKRLSRRSICFSRKSDMLEACVKLYCWQ